jgi:DNA-binding NarL/FixJ family response regulator
MEEKTVFHQSFEAGSRVYEFEVRKASTGAKYLVIKEIQQRGDEPSVRGMIMVFEDHLVEFRRAARAAMQFLRSGSRQATARVGEPKSYDVGSIRRDHPRAYDKWTAEEEANLKALAARGCSIKELAVQFHREPGAIRSRLERLGFPAPT